ncbi:MAG: hypothetical protein H0U54_14570 [Acidobacteria bacterium]|nr:hypothetical protein [Acidobacteriota bacterium]
MKSSKHLFLFLFLSVALAACSGTETKSPEANSAQSSTNQVAGGNSSTSVNSAAGNKRDPATVCAYLNSMGLTPLIAYKVSSGSSYSCSSSKSVPLDKEGHGMTFNYSASGDATSIESVNISATVNSSFKEAAEADEWVANASNEVWQKVFGKPLPDEIKEAILTSKGKKVEVRKTFAEPTSVLVKRDPRGGAVYVLYLNLTLPK